MKSKGSPEGSHRQGPRKMYEGGASPEPENTLGAKDKNVSIVGNPKAEEIPFFRDRDKQLDEHRANQPNMPTRRTSVGDKEIKAPKK